MWDEGMKAAAENLGRERKEGSNPLTRYAGAPLASSRGAMSGAAQNEAAASGEEENATEDGGVKMSTADANVPYDYRKSFSDQIEDFKNNLFPRNDSLIVGGTPDVFKKIGLLSLPMTYGQGHLAEVLRGNVADHDFGEANLKKLPEKIKEPIAIIASESQPTTSVVAILDLSHGGKKIITAVEIEKKATINSKRIDANAITTMHKRANAIQLFKNAIAKEVSGEASVYYYNKKTAAAVLSSVELQLLNGSGNSEGYVHTINDAGSKVKSKFSSITETQQFKRWFGDWQNHPESASKIVNEDGTPKIVYHQTENVFTVFDTRHQGAGTSDFETPFGVFLKPTANDIGLRGKVQMPLYASIRNPLNVRDRAELTRHLMQDAEYSRLYNEIKARDAEYKDKTEKAKKALADYIAEWRKNNPDAQSTALYDDKGFEEVSEAEDELIDEWTRLNDATTEKAKERITALLKEQKYDGVIIKNDVGSFGRSTEAIIALDNTQVKSATDNIGTFDKANPDIRYSKLDSVLEASEERARASEQNRIRLKAANDRLKSTIARWEKESRTQAEARYNAEDLNAVYNELVEQTGFRPSSSRTSPMSTAEAREKLRALANYLIANKKAKSDAEIERINTELFRMADELAEGLIENAWHYEDVYECIIVLQSVRSKTAKLKNNSKSACFIADESWHECCYNINQNEVKTNFILKN